MSWAGPKLYPPAVPWSQFLSPEALGNLPDQVPDRDHGPAPEAPAQRKNFLTSSPQQIAALCPMRSDALHSHPAEPPWEFQSHSAAHLMIRFNSPSMCPLDFNFIFLHILNTEYSHSFRKNIY